MTTQSLPSASHRVGYETTLLLQAELPPESWTALQTKLSQVIQAHQGELFHTEDWGKRRLAYPIQKQQKAHYFYLVYSGLGNVVQELEHHLKIQESVLRFLTVRLGEPFDAPAYLKKRAEDLEKKTHQERERESRRLSQEAEGEDFGPEDAES